MVIGFGRGKVKKDLDTSEILANLALQLLPILLKKKQKNFVFASASTTSVCVLIIFIFLFLLLFHIYDPTIYLLLFHLPFSLLLLYFLLPDPRVHQHYFYNLSHLSQLHSLFAQFPKTFSTPSIFWCFLTHLVMFPPKCCLFCHNIFLSFSSQISSTLPFFCFNWNALSLLYFLLLFLFYFLINSHFLQFE